ncbi:methylmalonyl Co-A mutase-associated GTPase MeaB [Pleomorphovibrio marinus]|uniref:methylmalonyl Co-A mutase-associated GTPase MeaB n=1 Tax=Pleomorphovibrio marinus TaxID=2164132 RepID=UPI000E0A12C0|nr:methylmalonyl Co-A mutase-associated GTPase MeaB [Pleomorphovibrio marinus]
MSRKKRPDKEAYIEGVLAGDRVMLSRAITLVESKLQADRELAEEVMDALMPHTGKSFRLGITGVPGVGKSTFIGRFGKEVVSKGHKLAVLAIDPSSPSSRGSILGDKTRMGALAADPRVYVRPSATGGALGGISANTREGSLICEAAGFDFIIIETVGVGQSEVAVRHMVDAFLLLLLPGAGDELQGLKKGIVEMADILVVNKADGQSVSPAREAQRAYSQAMKLFPPKLHNFPTKVLTCSSLTGDGIERLWNELTDYWQLVYKSGYMEEERRSQRVHWAKTQITDFIELYFYAHPSIKEEMPKLLQKVREGEVATLSAARKLMELFLQN